MSRIVRQSKFRHVFGTPAKVEQCYVGVKVSNTAWDTNFIAANPKYFAMMWDSAGGGVFTIFNNERVGKIAADVPMVTGHKAAVLDLDFNPFNDNLIASCSEDCYTHIWGIPEGGLKENMSTPLQTLTGHKRKIGTVNFHPCANNVLATSSADYTVKVWDIEKGDEMFSVGGAADLIMSVGWNKNGSLLTTVCKDKKLRIIDPRQSKIASEGAAHMGSKGMRVLWLPDKDKLLTTGFSKNSEREFMIWDPRSLGGEPLARCMLDSMSGVVMPFYDTESSILYLAGKGDGNVRYYEIVDDKPGFFFLSEYKSSASQRGCCMMPKRALNVSTCEIARLLKLCNDKKVEPVSFTVPRKSEIFQDDLYPLCFSGVSTITADSWQSGHDADPDCSFNHEKGFVAPVHAEFHPVVKEVEKPKSDREIREEYEQLKNRVSYLEAEIARKDARIKELEGKQ